MQTLVCSSAQILLLLTAEVAQASVIRYSKKRQEAEQISALCQHMLLSSSRLKAQPPQTAPTPQTAQTRRLILARLPDSCHATCEMLQMPQRDVLQKALHGAKTNPIAPPASSGPSAASLKALHRSKPHSIAPPMSSGHSGETPAHWSH